MTFKHSIRDVARRNLTDQQFGRLYEFFHGVRNIARPIQAMIWRRRHTGQRTYIDPTAHFNGWKNIKIGAHCVISEHCWFNVNGRNGRGLAMEIGDHSYIGRRNFFSSGKRIRLGPYALTGVDCKYMGSDHVFGDPMVPYIATGTTQENEIDIGVNCWIGAGVTILGNIKIGSGSIIGAGSFVLKDVPPFSLVIGSPARVIKRYDIEHGEWVKADEFSAAQEALLPDDNKYLEILQAARPYIIMPRPATGSAWGDLP